MNETANYYHAPELGGLEMLHAHYITHQFKRHVHDGYALGVITSGAEAFYYRGEQNVVAPAGAVAVINPGEVHTGHAVAEGGWSYRMFYPGITLMRSVAHELTGVQWDTPHFPEPIVWDAEAAGLLIRLHRTLAESDDALAREGLMREAFGLLLTRHAANRANPLRTGREREVVRRARQYLDESLSQNITLDDLADAVHMSPYHLLRVFKAATGMTPHAYRATRRLEAAKALLAAGTRIAEVATRTGFTDQSHLTRAFKGAVGVPPGAYQQEF